MTPAFNVVEVVESLCTELTEHHLARFGQLFDFMFCKSIKTDDDEDLRQWFMKD